MGEQRSSEGTECGLPSHPLGLESEYVSAEGQETFQVEQAFELCAQYFQMLHIFLTMVVSSAQVSRGQRRADDSAEAPV